ncbi:tRNA (adenosine(37)-N6)-threonylcarbamoyltransferase complex dimerization subunit type 1 TsaB [Aliiglaciecola sp. SL4]|uniref:tRNA (adenosine(37)-N6)-threonylcarbamoyltransferase complex dimerization subunit type 1 TsaB n=1 Tax=Aliiglaciecola sp. SL4 TaxID=3239806 RepID=UPI00355B4DEA
MKILAIDTATEACSAAISVEQKTDSIFEVCPQQHSQKLLPMVEQLLERNEQTLATIDYLVFGRGPGSFTGVRISTGIIQGLALGTEKPVVGISTLATMAQQAIDETQATLIAVAIDARMDEVYFALYRNENNLACLLGEEQVLGPDAVLELLTDKPDVLCGTGWTAYKAFENVVAQAGQPSILYPSSAAMIPLAIEAIGQDNVSDVENIQPVYLRDKVTWKKLPGRE